MTTSKCKCLSGPIRNKSLRYKLIKEPSQYHNVCLNKFKDKISTGREYNHNNVFFNRTHLYELAHRYPLIEIRTQVYRSSWF